MNRLFQSALILLVVSLPVYGADIIEPQNEPHLEDSRNATPAPKSAIGLDGFDAAVNMVIAGRVGVSDLVSAYMTMIRTDDADLQRAVARKIFQEKRRDPELMELIAEKLDGLYLLPGLSQLEQDAAAWFCKVLGQTGNEKYARQLAIVANSSPYKKIYQHAANYAMPGIDTVVTLQSQTASNASEQEQVPKFKLEGLYASEVTSTDHYYFDKRSYRSLNYQFLQDGNNVVGVNAQIKLKVIGKLEGDTITFYTLPSKMGPTELKGKWKVSNDGRELRGSWSVGGSGGKWNLTRID